MYPVAIGIYIYLFLVILYTIYFMYNNYMTVNKVVIFDMDETLGHFYQVSGIWYAIKDTNRQATKQDFFDLIDSFQECLRTHIEKILIYLKHAKSERKIHRVIIFTNNQGPKSWSNLVKDYFNYKLNTNLIDKVVGAYKVGNKQIEPHRTSHDKKYTDILKAANISKSAKLCFIDDQEHGGMKRNNIYYIKPPVYYITISKEAVIKKLKSCKFYNKFSDSKKETLLQNVGNYIDFRGRPFHYQIHDVSGKRMLKSIVSFVEKF